MNGFVHGSVLGHLLRMQSFNNVESISLPLNNVVHLHVPFWLVEVALFDGRLVCVGALMRLFEHDSSDARPFYSHNGRY